MPAKKKTQPAPAAIPNFSRAYDVFVGTMVTLVVRGIKGRSQGKITNIMLGGYLLDECEDYFYIGASSLEIHSAVKKIDVSAIISGDIGGQPQDEESDDDFEVPEGSAVN